MTRHGFLVFLLKQRMQMVKFNENTNDSFDSSNSWKSISFSYKFDTDDTLQIFYGSVRGDWIVQGCV